MRICPDCGVNELDKRYRFCSECAEDRKIHSKTIANHKLKEYFSEYQVNYYPEYRKKNKDKINEYMKNYMRKKRAS
jgi:DNA replication protein DnaC